MQNTHKRVRAQKPVLTYVLLTVVVLVAAGLTWRFGFPKSFSNVFAANEAKGPERKGMVAVLVSPVPLPAFTAIDPQTFIDQQTGDFRVAWVMEKVATDAGLMRDPAAMRGRVLKRDKAANITFSEADFYPRGSQASLTAALEPGQRSVHLNAGEIEGLRALKRFDRLDLYAVKVKPPASAGTPGYMSPEAAKAAEAGRGWATDRLIIAQNARILVPVPEGKNAKNPDNVEVAMTIDEATALADAKAQGATILCLGRSGQPGGDPALFTTPNEAPAYDTIHVSVGPTTSTAHVKATPEVPKPKPNEPPR